MTIVKLNVGGQIFLTTSSTLTNFEMFQNGEIQKMENGDYFVDANPVYFQVILDYLRMDGVFEENLPILKGAKALAIKLQLFQAETQIDQQINYLIRLNQLHTYSKGAEGG